MGAFSDCLVLKNICCLSNFTLQSTDDDDDGGCEFCGDSDLSSGFVSLSLCSGVE